MANTLSRFQKISSGSVEKHNDFTSVISSSGDFTRISGINAILNSWGSLLLIPLGTYVDDPTVGSNLYKYVFAQADEKTVERIKEEIEYRIPYFDDRAEIYDVNVTFHSNKKGFYVDIYIKYEKKYSNLTVSIDSNILKSITG